MPHHVNGLLARSALGLTLLVPVSARAQVARGVGTGAASGSRVALPAGRIVVEPDFLVTRDGDVPHVETMIAASPRKVTNLVAGAITLTSREGSWGCKAYASQDGGRAWTPSPVAEQVATGGGDPQVGFTPNGTALFACLAFVKDDTGRTRAALQVNRSEDGGLTWSRAADLGYSYDHPMLAVDQTVGRFAGRAYIGVLYGREYNIGIFRSTDEGRTWTGPVRLHSGGRVGANVFPLVVFSDGALLVPVEDFPLDGDAVKSAQPLTMWTALSEDGGVTFTPLRRAHTVHFQMDTLRRIILLGQPAFAADLSERHRDRLYTVWNDFGTSGTATARALSSYSDDRGRTWSQPIAVDPSAPRGAAQFNPALAVNSSGVVGVTWYDMRGSGDSVGWHQYFAASVDGGVSFLPAVQVSSEISRPFGAGNLAVNPMGFSDGKGPLMLSFVSAASRWGNGGDYSGLAADRDGVFHPFWADSRSGTFQGWTARIRVELPKAGGDSAVASSARPASTAAPTAAPLTAAAPSDVTSRVEVVADPSHYDAATRELELSLRLKNVSDRPIRGPLVVTVQRFGSSAESQLTESEKAREREQTPVILNAANAKPNDGAVFDYTPALGGTEILMPGAQSGPVRWRFRVKDPMRIPDVHLVITGVVDGGKK
jgi:hypothetical protein